MTTSHHARHHRTNAFVLPEPDPDLDDDLEFDDGLAATIDPTTPVLTDVDALDRVRRLVQTAYVERWWLLLLDHDGTQLPTLPQIEMPRTFGEAEAEQMAATLASVVDHLDIPALVLVWELPGTGAAESAARASILAAASTRLGAAVPRQVLVRRGGVIELWRP